MAKSNEDFEVDYKAECNVCQQICRNLNFFNCDHVLCDDCTKINTPLKFAPVFKQLICNYQPIIVYQALCRHYADGSNQVFDESEIADNADITNLSFEILNPEDAVEEIENNLEEIEENSKEIQEKIEEIEVNAEEIMKEIYEKLKLKEIKEKVETIEKKPKEIEKKLEKIETTLEQISEVPDANGFTDVSLNAYTPAMRDLYTPESPKKRFNLVLFSEAGYGKSTFINAFCNYLRFSSFDEAMDGDLKFLIPNTVFMQDEDLETKAFFCSADGINETQKLSETHKSPHFDITFEQYVLRLIKLRNVEHVTADAEFNEKQTLKAITASLNYYGRIHGALFLFRSNESSIPASFSFHLDKLASSFTQNFCFIYIDSGETFCRPGTTFTVLKSILIDIKERRTGPLGEAIKCDEENNFCLDSEALNAVIAMKSNLPYTRASYIGGYAYTSDSELEVLKRNWARYVDESHRLKDYILKCQEN